jgi:plasmid maintenance system killer protein
MTAKFDYSSLADFFSWQHLHVMLASWVVCVQVLDRRLYVVNSALTIQLLRVHGWNQFERLTAATYRI